MFARVHVLATTPRQQERGLELVRDQLLPWLRDSTGYRGLIRVEPDAHHAKSTVRCDARILDDVSRSDTYPYIEVEDEKASLGHEATVSKVGEDQLFYLMSRGLTEQQATAMIVNGFIEPVVKTLPMEYAIELSRLIELSMEGAVG